MEYMPSKVRSYYIYARVVDESVIERHFAWHGLLFERKISQWPWAGTNNKPSPHKTPPTES